MQPGEFGLVWVEGNLLYFSSFRRGKNKKGPFIEVTLSGGTTKKIHQRYSKKQERVLEPEEAIRRYPN